MRSQGYYSKKQGLIQGEAQEARVLGRPSERGPLTKLTHFFHFSDFLKLYFAKKNVLL